MNDTPLAKLDLAQHALAECKTAMEAKQIADAAEAARVYAAQGDKEYRELIAFSEQYRLPIPKAASILAGQTASNTNHVNRFKAGEFEIRDRAYANRVAEIVCAVRNVAPWASAANSMNAISRFVRVPEFNAAQFIKKCQTHAHMLTKQPSTEAYSSMYEAVYNMLSREKIPLAFMAREIAAKRGDLREARKQQKNAA